jgi:hypothetical protein
MATTPIYPVEMTQSVIVRDPATGVELARVDVPSSTAAPLQAFNVELTRLGYAPLFFNAETRSWATTNAGARRL